MNKSRTNNKKKVEEYPPEKVYNQIQQQLKLWTGQVKKKLSEFQNKHKQLTVPHTIKDILLNYLGFISEFINQDRLSPDSEFISNLDLNKNPQNLKEFFLSQKFLNLSRQTKLSVSITPQSLRQLSLLQQQLIFKIITLIKAISQGFISRNKKDILSIKQIGRSTHCQGRYYSYEIAREKTLIILLAMQKIPLFGAGKIVSQFQVGLFFQIERIYNGQQQIADTVHSIDQKYEEDMRFNFRIQDFIVDQGKKKPNVQYFSLKDKHDEGPMMRKYEIQPYKRYLVKEYQSHDYLFNMGNQKYQLSLLQTKKRQQDQAEQEEKYEKNQLSYNNKAKQYINFISSIPNFKFKLTKQQKEAFGKQGNIIVIGRSGTGKTLLSILRLYCLEILSKEEEIHYQILQRNPRRKCVQFYINSIFTQKNMFLTASSFLIEQILKQYEDMHYQVQFQHRRFCEECTQYLNLQRNQDNGEDIDLLLQKIEKRQKIQHPLSKISKKLFPQFLTIKSMISLIDCGLKRPFFNIEETKKIKTNKKAINIYHQNLYRVYEPYQINLKIAFKNKMKSYSKEQLKELKEKDGFVQATEVTYQYFQQIIWSEITETYFKHIKKDKNKLNPSYVWIQFFSVIKGSAKAHTTHLKCLSPLTYMKQFKNNLLSEEQKLQICSDIYYLFEQYQIWKIRNKAYDLMDVVNHILHQTMLNGYKDELVDNMFIDQVQDLTPATIYLVSKMTKHNIFFCGDTAQAISKGVSFKFSEIKTLFNKKYFKNYIKKDMTKQQSNLTVNFRSHNKILAMANTIVTLLQRLFPKMIDELQKQQSDLFGPPNLIINDGDQRHIYDILLGPLQRQEENAMEQQEQQQDSFENAIENYDNQQEEGSQQQEQQQMSPEQMKQKIDELALKEKQLNNRHLDTEQVILVRNKEQKEKLPSFLKKQMTLTCEEVKGLQYEDVIIYNFFGSSPCKEKWALLDYLDIFETFLDPAEFESKLSRRAIEQGNQSTSRNLTQQQKVQLGYCLIKKKYIIHEIRRSPKYQKIDIKLFYEISNELKQFYTLVTRAKNIVIIFDRLMPRQLLRFIKKIKIAKIYHQEQLRSIRQTLQDYRKRQSQERYLNKKRLWNEQGIKMLTRENYDEAIKCFEKADNKIGVERVKATMIIKQSQLQLQRIEVQMQNSQKLSREECKMRNLKLKRQKKEILQKMVEAAIIFEKINLNKKAASIYVKTELYEKAAQCYEKVENFDEAAQCYFKINQYKLALINFQKSQNIVRVFDCYIKLQRWRDSFSLLKQNNKIISQSLRNNKDARHNIKLCIKQILDGLINDQLIKSQIEFNKGFFDRNRQKEQNQLKIQIVNKNNKEVNQRMSNIAARYNEYLLSYIAQELIKAQKEELFLITEQKRIKQQQECLKIKENYIVNQRSKCEKQYKEIVYESTRLNIGLFQDIDQQQSPLKIRLLNRLQTYRNNKRKIDQEHKDVGQQILQVKHQVEEKKQLLSIFRKKYPLQSLQKSIKFIADLGKKSLKESKTNSKQPTLRRNNSIENQMEDDQLISNYSSSRQRDQYRKNTNKIYKVWMSQDTIQSLLGNTEETLSLAEMLIGKSQSNKFYSVFDHRQFMVDVQFEICKFDQDMKPVFQMLKILESVNNFSLCRILCDYYSLPYHLPILILNEISLKSNNLLEKRRIKDVVNISQQHKEHLDSIIKANQNLLQGIGKQVLETTCLKKATKQCSYLEFVIKNLIEGLILQGFYQNTLSFLDQDDYYKICFLFMNYEKLLEKSIEKGQSLFAKNQKQDNYYNFFDQDARNDEKAHLNLVNIFSIQKLFFDFDQCLKHPALSKAVEIDDIQLEDEQIQKCQKRAQQKKKEMLQKIPIYKQQVVIFLEQIRKKRSEVTQHKLRSSQIIKRCQQRNKYLKANIYKFTKQMEIVQIHVESARGQLNICKAKLQLKTQQKQKMDKNIMIEQKKADSLDLQKHSNQQIKAMINRIKQLKMIFEQVKRDQRYCSENVEQHERKYKQIQKRYDSINNAKSIDQTQKLKNDKIIKSANYQIQSNQKQFLKFRSQVQIQIDKRNNFIYLWEQSNDESRREQEVNRQALKQFKTQKVQAFNEEKKKQILYRIQKKSNLGKMKSKSLKFLQYYIKDKIKLKILQQKDELRQLMMMIFKNIKKVQDIKLSKVDISMVVIIYLRFLFSQDFRQACIYVCQSWLAFISQNYGYIQYYIQKRNQLQNQYTFNNRKIQQLQKKINDPQSQEILFRVNRYQEELNYFLQKNQYIYNQVSQIDSQLKRSGLNEIQLNPHYYLIHLLELIQKLKKPTASNMRLLQILLGFFQCRVIKDSKTLSFLNDEYVFVEADSILLKKMKEYGKLTFGYYFESANKVVLCKFSDAHFAILTYLQKQYQIVYKEIPQFKLKEQKDKFSDLLNKTQKKTTTIQKLDSDNQNRKLLETQILISRQNQKRQLQDLSQQFNNKTFVAKVRAAKQQVLEFYLAHEHKAKETFHFALFQVKQYANIELLLQKMTTCNGKMMRQLRIKMKELQAAKNEWIKNEKDKYEQSA